jgi:hypothetical protein
MGEARWELAGLGLKVLSFNTVFFVEGLVTNGTDALE